MEDEAWLWGSVLVTLAAAGVAAWWEWRQLRRERDEWVRRVREGRRR